MYHDKRQPILDGDRGAAGQSYDGCLQPYDWTYCPQGYPSGASSVFWPHQALGVCR